MAIGNDELEMMARIAFVRASEPDAKMLLLLG